MVYVNHSDLVNSGHEGEVTRLMNLDTLSGYISQNWNNSPNSCYTLPLWFKLSQGYFVMIHVQSKKASLDNRGFA